MLVNFNMSNFVFKMHSVSALLTEINSLKTKDAVVQALIVNGHPVLKNILKYMCDPTIKFLLPEGTPPYKASIFKEPKALLAEAHKIYLFVEGGNPNIKPLKRERLFIDILESIDKEDAELLIAMKDKINPYKYITPDIINTAFPGLIAK